MVTLFLLAVRYVDVVISKGPEMATIPSGLVGKQESAVTKTLA